MIVKMSKLPVVEVCVHVQEKTVIGKLRDTCMLVRRGLCCFS